MQKQNQSSKLILGLLAMTLVFSVVATVLLNYAYADGSSKQIQTPEDKAKKETQFALKETRKDAQQTTIKTREITSQHEKVVKADREKQLIQKPKISSFLLKQQDLQRARFEAKQSTISKTKMTKTESAMDSARLEAVIKQADTSKLKAEQLKAYNQTALKETRKYQQDKTVTTRNSNAFMNIDQKNTAQNKIKKTVFLPLHTNQSLLILASIQNNVLKMNQKT